MTGLVHFRPLSSSCEDAERQIGLLKMFAYVILDDLHSYSVKGMLSTSGCRKRIYLDGVTKMNPNFSWKHRELCIWNFYF